MLNQQQQNQALLTSNQMQQNFQKQTQPPQQSTNFPNILDQSNKQQSVTNLPPYRNSIINDTIVDNQQTYPPGHPLYLQKSAQLGTNMPAVQQPIQPTSMSQQFINQQTIQANQLSNQQQQPFVGHANNQLPIDPQLHNQPQTQLTNLQTNQNMVGLTFGANNLNQKHQLQQTEQFYPSIGGHIDTTSNLNNLTNQPSYALNDPMNQNLNQTLTTLPNQPTSFSSRPHTSHFSPQFQRKMPQIRPSMLRSKSKERDLPYQGRSPFDSPTSVSSSGSLTDQFYSNRPQYSTDYQKQNFNQPNHLTDNLDYSMPHLSNTHRETKHMKHIKYADDLDLDLSHHRTPFAHQSSNLKGQNQSFTSRSDRHLSCESPTADLNISNKHHSKRSMYSQSTGYHSLHTSPRKTPSNQICNSEICHHFTTYNASNQSICDECTFANANSNLKNTNICVHGHKLISPKHTSPSKNLHHHYHPVHSSSLHEHSNTCQSIQPCSTCSNSINGPQLSNMSSLTQQQQSFNAFHKQQEQLLKQQEMLVDGMKKIQKKKIRKLHEAWSPTTSSSSQLSPVDVGPLLDSIVAPLEKEIQKQEEKLQKLSEYRRQRKFDDDNYISSNLTQAKNSTITGLLDDFNKQMEQFKIKELGRENQDKLPGNIEENKKKEEKNRRYSLDSKVAKDYSPPRKIENKKLPTVTEADRLSSEIERNQSAIVRLLNARNAQSSIPFNDSTTLANATSSKSTLAVQPIKKTLEKIVSPVIDKTMHQQQLLITQQQQLIALQKEQNKLQQQLQGMLIKRKSEYNNFK